MRLVTSLAKRVMRSPRCRSAACRKEIIAPRDATSACWKRLLVQPIRFCHRIARAGERKGLSEAARLLDTLDRPAGRLTHQRLGIAEGLLQGRQSGWIALVAQHNGCIPQQPAALGAHQGRAAKTLAKLLFGKAKQLDRIDRLQLRPRLEGGLFAGRGLSVPRTDFLAYVTAEQPIPGRFTQVSWNRATQLDGEITDTAPGIELTRSGKGLRRTGIQAGGAGTAVTGLVSRIRLQVDVKQESTDEEVATQPPVEQHGIFAEPTETRPPCKIALQERRGVHDAATLAAWCLFLDLGEELFQTSAQD